MSPDLAAVDQGLFFTVQVTARQGQHVVAADAAELANSEPQEFRG